MATSDSSFNAKTEAFEVVDRFKDQVRDKTSTHMLHLKSSD